MLMRRRTGGGRSRPREPTGHALEERVVHAVAQQFQPLLVAIIVSIDIHQFLERFGSFWYIASLKINVKELDKNLEVFRFPVQLVVKGCPKLQDGLRLRMLFAH